MHRSEHFNGTALLLSAILLLTAVLPFLGTAGALTFGKDVQIKPYDPDNRDQRNFDIAASGRDDSAEVYVVYEDLSAGANDPHVWFQRSMNGGTSWQTPIDLMRASPVGGDKQLKPVIDVYENKTAKVIAVAYLDSTYRTIPQLTEFVVVVRTSTDSGTTWSADKLVTPDTMSGYPSDNIDEVDMAFDPYGNLFVTWTNKEPEHDQIDISYSTDLGVTWSTPTAVKTQPEAPDPDWFQKGSTVAANGQYVFVGWEVQWNYRPDTWMSKAPTSNLAGYPNLVFETPVAIPKPHYSYDMYQTFLPNMEADVNGVHLTWWDFSTDPTKTDNKDISKDRPCIKYTRSTDNGATWTVNGNDNIIVNVSQNADKWHGRPDIGLGSDGTIAISWMDYTLGNTNIFTASSTDGGTTWSKPARVNDHAPTIYRDEPRVAVDSGGSVHVMWWVRDPDMQDMDMKHARSIVNKEPEQIDDLQVLVTDERYALVSWTPNLEPDFKMYRTYISETPDFTPSDIEWPDGPKYNESFNQLMNMETFNKEMDSNTQYYAKVVVEDQEGMTSVSNEVAFKTKPINQPPSFTKNISTIYLMEDESREGAINLSYWVDMGWIVDDAYNGFSGLEFGYEQKVPEPNLTVRTRKIGLVTEYWYFDIFRKIPDWYGKDQFRIVVSDMGKDGGFGTGDEKVGYSNWFTVQVNSTNDPPFWSKFQDLNTLYETAISGNQKEFRPLAKDIGCIEGLEYEFAITANDIDYGDFIRFSASDPRVYVTVDQNDPKHKSIFSITPTNDDVPELNITITAKDEALATKNLTIYIPVENVNNAPFFLSVDGNAIDSSGDLVRFEVLEKGSLTFNVSAGDIDYQDTLDLNSPSEKPKISKVSPTNWTVSVTAAEEDAHRGSIAFDLQLWDRQKTDYSVLAVNITILNVQDPPEWIAGSGKIKVEYTEDLEDMNEWGGKKGGTKVQAEWGEDVRFEGFASDRDLDILNYTWTIRNENSGEEFKLYGSSIFVRFYPSNGNLSIIQSEKFFINLSVSDGHAETANLWYQIQQWLWSDDDNDNDGMPDKRETFFFGNLDHDPDVDEDSDGYTNIQEIGFQVPQYDQEKLVPYTINVNEVNPVDSEVYPGHPRPPKVDDDDDTTEEGFFDKIPLWLLLSLIATAVVVLAIAVGIVVVIRLAKKREEDEDMELEKKVADMERRQQELSSLYGVQKAGDAVGPDQSTLDDLTLDLGGQIYHEEGRQSLVSEKDEDKKVKSGPVWEAGTGPLFEESAPGLEFGESMEMDAMEIDPETTEIDHDSLDEDALEESMDDLLDAAEEYDEEAVKNAGGGNVLVGALTMEEQVRVKQQGGSYQDGPRVPPPGQQPPSMQRAPAGQTPPTMQAAPMPRPVYARPMPQKKDQEEK
ncbi:MAG: hypothetical protein ACMUFK_01920 [Thermoplasmatota archaeon]